MRKLLRWYQKRLLPRDSSCKSQVVFTIHSGCTLPCLLSRNCCFQNTWCRGFYWNDLLPSDLGARWPAWVSTLPSLLEVHISGWLATRGGLQVHIFCDASENEYGAALYVRSAEDDTTLIRLAFSKNRLAPVKRTFLPKKELLAALVGTRLLHYFCTATGNDIN
jgi:hypothetical protein